MTLLLFLSQKSPDPEGPVEDMTRKGVNRTYHDGGERSRSVIIYYIHYMKVSGSNQNVSDTILPSKTIHPCTKMRNTIGSINKPDS